MRTAGQDPPSPLLFGIVIGWVTTIFLCVPAAVVASGAAWDAMAGNAYREPGETIPFLLLLPAFAVLGALATVAWIHVWRRAHARARAPLDPSAGGAHPASTR